ncbi:hypothetical protein J6590_095203 [Homalodisca vitripennis]|nr:hypothetical protein J6590_095203 [Homalodisca vitripennis]
MNVYKLAIFNNKGKAYHKISLKMIDEVVGTIYEGRRLKYELPLSFGTHTTQTCPCRLVLTLHKAALVVWYSHYTKLPLSFGTHTTQSCPCRLVLTD